MATSNDEIYVKIIADTNSAVNSLANLAKSVIGTYLSFQTFKKVIVDSFKEYLESEKAEQRLAAAIRITGQQRTANLPGMLSYAKSLQQITGYQDEETESAMGLLMQLGNLSSQGAMKIIPFIQDFASAMGLDLVQAATLVGKSMGSTTNMLGRYGIQIKEGLEPSQKFVAIMDQMQKKFGGFAAEIQSTTTAGQLKEFANDIKEFQEQLGYLEARLLSPVFKELLKGIRVSMIMDTSVSGMSDRGQITDAIKKLSEERDRLNQSLNSTVRARRYAGKEVEDIGKISDKIAELRNQLNSLPKDTIPNVLPSQEYVQQVNTSLAKYDSMYSQYMEHAVNYAELFNEMATKQAMAMAGPDYLNRLNQTGKTADPAEQAKELASQMQTVADATKGFMEALATGDVSGFFQQLIQQAVTALVPMALLAAATAATHGDFVTMTVWLAVAGMTLAAGVGFSGAGGGGGNGASSLPHYASGTDYVPQTGMAVVHQGERITPYGAGGGGMTVHVYGSVWAAKDLARELASIQGQW